MLIGSLKGYVPYDQALKLQHHLVQLRILDRIPDTLLFLEHEPVVTRGRGLQWQGKPRPRAMPVTSLPSQVPLIEVERGGDLTYHGPGQWVMYPICRLPGEVFPFRDLGAWIRTLEQWVLDEVSDRMLEQQKVVCVERKPQATGVWLNHQKIASLGIAVRQWVSFHGVALNVVNDLSPFFWISPCGLDPELMTRLSDWVQLPADWRKDLEVSMVKRIQPMDSQIQWKFLTCEEALEGGMESELRK